MSFWGGSSSQPAPAAASPAAATAEPPQLADLPKLERIDSAGAISHPSCSSRAGRCDTATYAEAMQTVSELGAISASSEGGLNRRVTNRTDRFILEALEEHADDGSSSVRSDSIDSPPTLRKMKSKLPHSSTKIPTSDTVDSLPSHPPPESTKPDVLLRLEDLARPVDWAPHIRKLLLKLSWVIPIEFVVGLAMLSPTIAVIALYASYGNISVFNVPDATLPSPPPPPPLGVRINTGGIFLLILRPMYALLTARFVAVLLKIFFTLPFVQYALPGFALLLLHHAFTMSWTLPAILYPAAIGFFYGIQLDHEAWDYLLGVTHFLALAFWLMAAGFTSVGLDGAIAIWQSQLTVQHYENRSASAYYIQKALRKIAAAARAAQRRTDKELEMKRKDEIAAQVLQAQARAFAERRAARVRRHHEAAAGDGKLSSGAASPFRFRLSRGRSSNHSRTNSRSASPRVDATATAVEAPSAPALARGMIGMSAPPPVQPPTGDVPADTVASPADVTLQPALEREIPPLPAAIHGASNSRSFEVHVLSPTAEEKLALPPRPPVTPRSPSTSRTKRSVDAPPVSKSAKSGSSGSSSSSQYAWPAAPGLEKAQQLDKRLNALAGPLDFGSDLSSANTLVQARRRAIRLWSLIVAQPELRNREEEGQPTTVDRDRLLAWAHKDGKPPHPRLAGLMFTFGQEVDEEHFVAVVEQSYKEQRLITASVAAFDRLHNNVRIFLQLVLLLIFLIILLALFSVSIVTWLLPLGSAVLSVAVLAGGITSDVLDSFFFAYIIRPYDIGDRVSIAPPGQASGLYSLVVKDVFLMRTHFYTSNGESLVINNSALRRMGITNFHRSGPMTLMVELMVPAATPSAKLTELADAITSFIEKSSDWKHVDLHFYSTHFELGHMILRMWVETTFPSHELGLIYSARGTLLLFCHAYMQSAGIEYLKPTQPIRVDKPPNTSSQSLAELFERRM